MKVERVKFVIIVLLSVQFQLFWTRCKIAIDWVELASGCCCWRVCGSAFGHPSRPHSTPDPTHIRHFITPHQAFSNKWLAARQLRLRPLSSRQPVPLFLSAARRERREKSGAFPATVRSRQNNLLRHLTLSQAEGLNKEK
jgi:hypothetical protein